VPDLIERLHRGNHQREDEIKKVKADQDSFLAKVLVNRAKNRNNRHNEISSVRKSV
jgi:hypothetical protein